MKGESGYIPDLFDTVAAEAAVLPVTSTEALALLDEWVERDWIRALDHAFAAFVCNIVHEQGEQPSAMLALLAAMVSHQVGRGHVCLDVRHLCRDTEPTLVLPPEGAGSLPADSLRPSDLFADISPDELIAGLDQSGAVGNGGQSTPLVLDGSRLYLRRFWRYEQAIAAGIRARLEDHPELADAGLLSRALDSLFGTGPEPDYQKIACALAARNRFSVITGGPGTGKTTTVVNLLAALQSVACESAGGDGTRGYLRIRLSAPTGKAAARLSDSIGSAVDRLPLENLPGRPDRSAIPVQVTTLHRLLGSRPGSRSFRHNEDNPLPLDILVIDEASMVDVDMMASVFSALPDRARLIMLGDKDQLASVDAGAVLGELCQRAEAAHYLPATVQWLESVTGCRLPAELTDTRGLLLDQAVAMLRKSYRFDENSGIGVLAAAINAGRLDRELVSRCRQQAFDDVAWLAPDWGSAPFRASEPGIALLADHALTGSPQRFHNSGAGRRVNNEPVAPPVGYGHYLRIIRDGKPGAGGETEAREQWDAWARAVLEAFNHFKVLCALRQGPFGVEGLNREIAERLRRAGLIDRTEGWYDGRPVLITGNDYNLGLMNGDIGVTLSVPRDRDDGDKPADTLRVAFPSSDGSGGIRWISPSRLQSLETVYAMTVHKSQGSEFTHACLVIPDRLTPVLTRELIYTGVTRARHWLSLVVSREGVLEEAVGRGVVRASGLARLLT
ncbi:exodeoxyribonuclease V subunit alpha [Marinobacter orientalis]|uniref:RecBCD enzyme subunit RecD n=1 Tax=Marinobacter orientalis TaxID=1928859 RepID=A0A7Y0NKE5_9GAMM|nr:exodeoxyribonuclease V subunit alpha [Marinobacter orientalis]NMT63065.1 exodeoxyribonuclease V subunit alpha [Marinobacter orientalis]TGX51725.1 exodeoxyribonuclease V subunit alpha [Marinobacter orientalis]